MCRGVKIQSMWLSQVLVLFVFRPVDGISFEVLPMGINWFNFVLREENVLLFWSCLFSDDLTFSILDGSKVLYS